MVKDLEHITAMVVLFGALTLTVSLTNTIHVQYGYCKCNLGYLRMDPVPVHADLYGHAPKISGLTCLTLQLGVLQLF